MGSLGLLSAVVAVVLLREEGIWWPLEGKIL